jgi:hypothetical protein
MQSNKYALNSSHNGRNACQNAWRRDPETRLILFVTHNLSWTEDDSGNLISKTGDDA